MTFKFYFKTYLNHLQFTATLNANRRTLVSKVRDVEGRIFPILAEFRHVPMAQRAKHPEFRAAIYGPDEIRVKYAPVLFPGRNASNLKFIFMAPELPKVPSLLKQTQKVRKLNAITLIIQMLRVILFARSSLSGDKRAPSRPTFGEIWGVTDVSPGSIAFVATLVRSYQSILVSDH